MNISKHINTIPRIILRTEGFVVLASSLFLFSYFKGSWILFVLLFLVPDISILGYFINKKIGPVIYNVIHNYILSGFLMFMGHVLSSFILFELGVILAAHVGMDRMFGFGLKYPKDFSETHLQKV